MRNRPAIRFGAEITLSRGCKAPMCHRTHSARSSTSGCDPTTLGWRGRSRAGLNATGTGRSHNRWRDRHTPLVEPPPTERAPLTPPAPRALRAGAPSARRHRRRGERRHIFASRIFCGCAARLLAPLLLPLLPNLLLQLLLQVLLLQLMLMVLLLPLLLLAPSLLLLMQQLLPPLLLLRPLALLLQPVGPLCSGPARGQ